MRRFTMYFIIVLGMFAAAVTLISPNTPVMSMDQTCVTPTPVPTDETVPPVALSSDFYLSATKSITLTTVFTIKNLEPNQAYVTYNFYSIPDCEKVFFDVIDPIPGRKTKIYSTDIWTSMKSFSGEIHIRSGLVVTGTSKIIQRPTKIYIPVVRK